MKALNKWKNIRKWVSKNIKIRRTYRVCTAIMGSGWCCLEVYPDGDCACFGGPGYEPGDKELCPRCVMHGMDVWRLRDDYCICTMRTTPMEHFILPGEEYICGHLQLNGDERGTSDYSIWVLNMLVEYWKDIRDALMRAPPEVYQPMPQVNQTN